MSTSDGDSLIQRMEESPGPRFALVCLLIIVLICLLMTLPETPGGRAATTSVAGLVMLTSVWAARVRSRVMHVAVAVVIFAVLVSIAALVFEGDGATTQDEIVMTIFTLAMPVAIVRGLRDERSVNIQTVFGAISLYFMLGLFFAFLISLVVAAHHRRLLRPAHQRRLLAEDLLQLRHAGHAGLRRPHPGYGDRAAAGGVRDRDRQPLPCHRGQPHRGPLGHVTRRRVAARPPAELAALDALERLGVGV